MSWEPVVYRDIWADDLRLIIDGKDVTYLRGVAAQFGGYQLQQPHGYGPADFAFPQVTELEVDKFGVEAPLKWLRKGAIARLVPVVDGVRGDDVWRGILTIPKVSGRTVQVHCDGEASGKLVLRNKHADPFWQQKDVGLFIRDAFNDCDLPMTPRLGTTTGIVAENRGGGTDYLQWVNGHLADAITEDGDQYTVDPVFVNGRHTYQTVLKDTTTIHATVFLGGEGVEIDVASDLSEEPTTWYGTGIAPPTDDGYAQKWSNVVAPGIQQDDPPPFAGTTLTLGSSGEQVSILHSRLIGRGYMSRPDASADYDADTVAAVKDLQEDAGLAQTGDTDEATWNAAFDLSVTGLDVRQARVLPLAQLSAVRKWDVTASGALLARNPDHDPDVQEVDIDVDHGPGVRKSRARQWSKRQMRRVQNEPNWVGTLALNGADVFAGNVTRATVSPVPMSRLDLRPGMNIMVRDFDGDTLFHMAGINVDSDKNVRAAIDTKARDLQTVGEIIARNKESRRDPRREFVQAIRGRSFNTIDWSEIGGLLDVAVPLTGGTWNVFPVPAGQGGMIERLRTQLSPATEYVIGLTAQLVYAGALNRDVGPVFDQLDVDGNDISNWIKPAIQRQLKREHFMLYTAGQHFQPCGYSPGKKNGNRIDEAGLPIPTGDPLTGEHEDDAGIAFHTFAQPVLYVCIYPRADCTVQTGRVFWPVQSENI